MRQKNPMKLTPTEKERGWVIYRCPKHGDLVAGSIRLTKVTCACGEVATPTRSGRRLSKALRASLEKAASDALNT